MKKESVIQPKAIGTTIYPTVSRVEIESRREEAFFEKKRGEMGTDARTHAGHRSAGGLESRPLEGIGGCSSLRVVCFFPP